MLDKVTAEDKDIIEDEKINIDDFPIAKDMKVMSKLKYLEIYKIESAKLIALIIKNILSNAEKGELSMEITIPKNHCAIEATIKKAVDFFENRGYHIRATDLIPSNYFEIFVAWE